MVNGERHGLGIQWSGTGERHEGYWYKDKRHGFGLMLGGHYPFLFGKYDGKKRRRNGGGGRGEPIGQHIAFDYHTDTVLLEF